MIEKTFKDTNYFETRILEICSEIRVFLKLKTLSINLFKITQCLFHIDEFSDYGTF